MPPLTGLIAAAYTPLHEDGGLNLPQVPAVVDRLLADGIDGFYVCGSTGEGMSLSTDERRAVTEAYVSATAGRVPVIVQIGHNSLAEARALAAHARQVGADVVSATCPSYFKIGSVEMLVDCMADLAAAAPDLPFYYYHIPRLTSTPLDMVEFLRVGGERIPNLAGLKYTTPTLHEYLACREVADGRFDILWGTDEMLLAALATGARGAIGSTYNFAPGLYRRIIDAFEAGNLAEARREQSRSVQMIRIMAQFPFHSAMKQTLRMTGLEVGPCRLPLAPLTPAEVESLRSQLESIGFFDWR